MDPELDLAIERVIHAPRAAVWAAWTRPELFAQWWIPQPYVCRVDDFRPYPGGGFVTAMSEDGTTFGPHMDAAFVMVEEPSRLVFTNALSSGLRPARPQPVRLTAEVTLTEDANGTSYRIVARHGDPADLARHKDLGLVPGWTFVTRQLAELAESQIR